LHAGRLLAGIDGMAFDEDGIERAHDAERNAEGLGDGDDAREVADAQFKFAIEGAALSFLIADLLNIEREIENVAGIEAKMVWALPRLRMKRPATMSNTSEPAT